jgi:hypothetical protein
MLEQEYDSRYAKAEQKFMNTAQQDGVKWAFTMDTCGCNNLQLLWMFALQGYDPTPGASNVLTDRHVNALFCRMKSDNEVVTPAGTTPPPVVIPPPEPGPTFEAEWAWTDTDPYVDLIVSDELTYNGSGTFAEGADIYADFRTSGAAKYMVLRYPTTESNKVSWRNDQFNYGSIPDSNFQAGFTAHGYKYVVSRVPLTLNATELTKFY